eukprot:TCONS_00053419-protein
MFLGNFFITFFRTLFFVTFFITHFFITFFKTVFFITLFRTVFFSFFRTVFVDFNWFYLWFYGLRNFMLNIQIATIIQHSTPDIGKVCLSRYPQGKYFYKESKVEPKERH